MSVVLTIVLIAFCIQGLVKFAVPKSPASLLRGGDEIASDWLQPRIGSDVALFKGLAKAVLERGATRGCGQPHHAFH